MTTEIDLERIRAETPGLKNGVHLMASGAGLMPDCVIEAIMRHIHLEAEIGGYEAAEQQVEPLEQVYDSIARHIGVRRHEIALMEDATHAWCNVFYALPLKPGSRILTCEAEYAANYVAFLQRAKKDNLRIDVVPSDASGQMDVVALEAMMGEDVGLIAITWVPTNGGLVNPAAEVGKVARKHGVPYLLDACQALGQMPIDVAELGCDFLSATGRKFMRGPRGTGFLYVREAWLDAFEPVMIDLFSAPWVAHDRYELRRDARRFETWENAYALRAGLGAAFDYADAIGIKAIEARVNALAAQCRGLLSEIPEITLRDIGTHHCGIVSFTAEGVESDDIVQKMGEAGFVLGTSSPASARLDAERRSLPTVVRMAPHYYNSEEEIKACMHQLARLL